MTTSRFTPVAFVFEALTVAGETVAELPSTVMLVSVIVLSAEGVAKRILTDVACDADSPVLVRAVIVQLPPGAAVRRNARVLFTQSYVSGEFNDGSSVSATFEVAAATGRPVTDPEKNCITCESYISGHRERLINRDACICDVIR
jgi:hypothetical protein